MFYIWFFVLWNINHCWLFNPSIYIYIIYMECIWFVNTFCRYSPLNNQLVLALAFQFIISKVKLVTLVEGDPRAPFSIATTPRYTEGGATPFPGVLHFTFDPYLIMLSVKQGSMKYHFLSLWYDSTWDWTQVSQAIDKHSNYYANVRFKSKLNGFKYC